MLRLAFSPSYAVGFVHISSNCIENIQLMQLILLCDLTPCSLIGTCQHFEETCCLHLAVKMKVAFPAKHLCLSTKLHGASAVREDVASRTTCEHNPHSADSALNFVGKQISSPAVPSEVPNIVYLFSHSFEKQGVCINWHVFEGQDFPQRGLS
jgi:hypothetical protein